MRSHVLNLRDQGVFVGLTTEFHSLDRKKIYTNHKNSKKCPYSREDPRSSKDSSTPHSEEDDFIWEEVSSGNKRGSEIMDDSDSNKNARELKQVAIEEFEEKKISADKQYQASIKLVESKGTKETGMNIIESVLWSLAAAHDQHKDPRVKQRCNQVDS